MYAALLLAFLPFQETPDQVDLNIDGFRFTPGKQSVGTVYHYKKSNIDGSTPSHVDLYIASETRIESFKYHEGGSEATLVTAEMDWKTFSVGTFTTHKLQADGTRRKLGTLQAKGSRLHGKLNSSSFIVEVKSFPWHTYDFDLASLNVSLRYLTDPEGSVQVNMIDQVRGLFTDKGFVELFYLGDEKRAGVPCRHYNLDGPGLNDRGGELWVRKGEDPVIVDYEIDLPDESSMRSGKLLLVSTETLSKQSWTQHLAAALAPEIQAR